MTSDSSRRSAPPLRIHRTGGRTRVEILDFPALMQKTERMRAERQAAVNLRILQIRTRMATERARRNAAAERAIFDERFPLRTITRIAPDILSSLGRAGRAALAEAPANLAITTPTRLRILTDAGYDIRITPTPDGVLFSVSLIPHPALGEPVLLREALLPWTSVHLDDDRLTAHQRIGRVAARRRTFEAISEAVPEGFPEGTALPASPRIETVASTAASTHFVEVDGAIFEIDQRSETGRHPTPAIRQRRGDHGLGPFAMIVDPADFDRLQRQVSDRFAALTPFQRRMIGIRTRILDILFGIETRWRDWIARFRAR